MLTQLSLHLIVLLPPSLNFYFLLSAPPSIINIQIRERSKFAHLNTSRYNFSLYNVDTLYSLVSHKTPSHSFIYKMLGTETKVLFVSILILTLSTVHSGELVSR